MGKLAMLSKITSRFIVPLRQRFNESKNKKILALALFLITAVSVGALALKSDKDGDGRVTSDEEGFEKLVIPEREQAFFELQTEKLRKFGIIPQENFVLKTQQPISLEFLNSILTTSEGYVVEQIGDQEFRIKNRKLLGLDQPLTITLNTVGKEIGGYTFDRNYSWSFQSQGKFRVVSTIPGNEKTKVPLNTGIEIIFNQDDFADPTRFIEVTPKIKFETKIVDETLAIIPQSELLPETIYTVILRNGLRLNSRTDQINEDYVFSFQTREKPTPQEARPWLSIRDTFVQTSPTEPFITKVIKNDWNDEIKVDLRVYRFNNASDFITTRQKYDKIYSSWNDYYPQRHNFSEGLAQVLKEDVSVQKHEEIEYLQLSQSLEPGYYLVEFHLDGRLISDQVWYQSTVLTGYVSLGKEQTIVWANNLADQRPASSTLVRSHSTGGTWYANSDGVAKFPTSNVYFDENSHYFELNDPVGNSLVLPVPSQKGRDRPGNQTQYDYWSYIYTEKYFYASDDTVNYWGLLKDRDTGSIPLNARLVLITSQEEEVFTRNLTFSSDGSFIGNIPLESAPNGWYTLNLKVADEVVNSINFSVREYLKPDMKIEISADKKAMFTDEEVKFKVKSSFFDETPGVNIKLNIHENSSSKKTEVQTDNNGTAEYSYKPTYEERNYYPRFEGISALPALTQESIIQGYGSVQVYGPKVMVTTQRSQTNEKATITATINKIDLTEINEGTTNDPKGDTVAGHELKLKVVENWTERKEDGVFYNFIEKITYKKYRYDRHSEQIVERNVKTDEVGKIFFEFDMKNDRSYELTIETSDEKEHKVTQKHYFYASKWSSYYEGDSNNSNIYLDLAFGRDTNKFSVGDNVNIKLTQQGDDYKDEDNDAYLFTTSQRGNQDTTVTDIPYYSFTFGDRNIPNTYISAVVFNGNRYKRAISTCRREWICSGYYYDYSYSYNSFQGMQVVYDSEDSRLDIEIKYSEKVYAPGDSALIETVVTKNNSPVADASVNLIMVDAALAAIGGARKPTVLSGLYENVPHQIYYVYTSHEPIVPDLPIAEKGGGGGDRELFKDTAVFLQSQSDASGIARFSFILPDNITTWLTYAQAVTANFDAGIGESSIIVTKDFFVTSKFPKSILEVDETYVSANSFGKILKDGDEVDYTVIYTKNNQEIERQTAKEKAFNEIDFKFPKLVNGTYNVTVRGEANDRTDGIKLPIEVIYSRFKQNYSAKHAVSEGEKLSELIPDKFLEEDPVVLIVTDKGKGIFFSTLTRYCWGGGSNRLEKKISSKEADILLEEKFDYDKCLDNKSSFKDFQNNDGGLAQVKWGGSSLPTSLWAVIVAPEEFNKEKLISYFEEQFVNNQGSTIQKIEAGWALSFLGESKLRELKSLMTKMLSFEEKVNLALALSYLGDTEIAREMYLDILADYGYTLPPYIRIDAEQNRGGKAEDFVIDTGKVLLLGELVDKKYNNGLYAYINDYRGSLENYLINLAEMAYIEREIDSLPDSDTTYNLTTSSGTTNVTLDRGRSETYEFTSFDIDRFDFTLTAGKTELLAKYMIGIDTLNTKTVDNRLSLKRSYSKVKDDANPIKPGDIVRIDLDLTMNLDSSPKGSYEVKDILPSGLTYFSNPGSFGLESDYYVNSAVNNVATFNVYNSDYYFKDGHKKITYYARASAVGKFKAEPAVFQSQDDLTVLAKTDEGEIVVE